MKPIKNILVPTDFSDTAQNALIYAIKFARMANAKVTVLHAYHVPIAAVGAEFPIYNGPYADEIESEVQANFEEIKRNFLYADLPEYEFISRLGMAQEVIENAASSGNFDLVIMGTHGGNAMQEVIGSTTSDMIKKSSIPILAIPPNVQFKKVNRIVFATDYGKIGEPQEFAMLLTLAEIFHAEIDVLHINPGGSRFTREETASGAIIDQYLKKVKHAYNIAFNEDLEKGIEEFIETKKADLLAMMPRKRGLFESMFHSSLTKKMAFHTHIPLLTFHA